MVHPDNGILFDDKKNNQATKRHGWTLNTLLLNERSHSAMVTYDIISTIWHFGQGKSMDTLKFPVVSISWGHEEGWIGRSQRMLRPVKILCMIP